MIDFRTLAHAIQFATEAHKEQKRWDNIEPYIEHVHRVASRVGHLYPDTATLVAAYLHDVVEDTPVTFDEVYKEFGPVVYGYVELLTQGKGEDRGTYLSRVLSGPSQVRAIKFADRCDNMAGLHTAPDDKKQEGHILTYINEVETFFLPNQQGVPAELVLELMNLNYAAKRLL